MLVNIPGNFLALLNIFIDLPWSKESQHMFNFNNRYEFNKETLSYDKVQLSLREKIIRFTTYSIVFAAFVTLLAYGIFVYFYDTSSHRSLKRENEYLKEQYNVLNDRLDQFAAALEDIQKRDDNIYRVMLQKEPLSPSVRKAGFGGSDKYEKMRGYNNTNMVVKTAQRLDNLSKQLVVQSKSYDEVIQLAKQRNDRMSHIPAIHPVSMKTAYVTSHYGYRFHPILKRRELHSGVDFAAPIGTEIHATADGKVVKVNYSGGYGRMVTIDHGYGYKTRYAHMHKVHVRRGETVKRGQVIGLVGNSGLSTGPHLHYEVIKNNIKVNPINYYFNDITPREYDQMIRLVNNGQNNTDQANS